MSGETQKQECNPSETTMMKDGLILIHMMINT